MILSAIFESIVDFILSFLVGGVGFDVSMSLVNGAAALKNTVMALDNVLPITEIFTGGIAYLNGFITYLTVRSIYWIWKAVTGNG